jgi:hypothetical protein
MGAFSFWDRWVEMGNLIADLSGMNLMNRIWRRNNFLPQGKKFILCINGTYQTLVRDRRSERPNYTVY